LYVHTNGNFVAVLSAKDLSLVQKLDLGKRIIVVNEVNGQYIFFGCEGGSTFSFDLKELTRIKQSSTKNPCTARMYIEGD